MSDDAATPEILDRLAGNIPYIRFLGLRFERRGDEITALMPYKPDLIGNPLLPALHGGATGAFLEITAVMQVVSDTALRDMAAAEGDLPPDYAPRIPKPVDITFDYLRSGKPMDTYARALVQRRGRRVANVRVEAWQEERAKLIATAHGHFLLDSGENAA
jgi:acyl-coenzyme A thioesterase PaaI-like protein